MKALFDVLTPQDADFGLASAIDPDRLPAHIAIIMDGNGRWAKRRSLPRVAGHKAGIEPVRITVETCARLGLKALTLYAFSVENWKRPRAEVEMLWRLLRLYLRAELPDMARNDIRFTAIGRHRRAARFCARRVGRNRPRDRTESRTASSTGHQLRRTRGTGGRRERS